MYRKILVALENGRADDTLVPHIAFSQPMVRQYAELFRGLDGAALDELADSFAFANCTVREGLRERLSADALG